jgi:hypothetical protein
MKYELATKHARTAIAALLVVGAQNTLAQPEIHCHFEPARGSAHSSEHVTRDGAEYIDAVTAWLTSTAAERSFTCTVEEPAESRVYDRVTAE